jgi:hypothetical protein
MIFSNSSLKTARLESAFPTILSNQQRVDGLAHVAHRSEHLSTRVGPRSSAEAVGGERAAVHPILVGLMEWHDQRKGWIAQRSAVDL